MTTHERECRIMKRELEGCQATLAQRFGAALPDDQECRDAFEEYLVGISMAVKHSSDETRKYAEASCEQLVSKLKAKGVFTI